MVEIVTINGEKLNIEDVVKVARSYAQVKISLEAKNRIERCHQLVDKFVKEKKVLYGVTTGFGSLSTEWLSQKDVNELQVNLIKSHSAGVGDAVDTEFVRAMMLLRANTLAKGNSGVRTEIIDTLIKMLNERIHPIIPEKGSVGASGDLAPLSHMALVLIGDEDGETEYKKQRMSATEAMKKAGIRPLILERKEGIALNNGSQLMTAIGLMVLFDAESLVQVGEIAAAMSLEAMMGISDAFDEKIHQVRPYLGQIASARNIRALIDRTRLVSKSDEIINKIKNENVRCRSPQDPYSLRCIPQVIGSIRDSLSYVRKTIEIEINSATDNPLIFPEEEECLSGGNFHGQPIAVVMDLLAISLTTLGNISERRTARLLDNNLSNGLPAFLITPGLKKGLHSGFMMAQCTAAALASENKVFSSPASVDSIPTSANFEDFVSMGTIAARKAAKILENTRYIVAIELLCAAQGVEFRDPKKMGSGTRIAYECIRKEVPALREDRVLFKDIERVVVLIKSGELLRKVENHIGKLK